MQKNFTLGPMFFTEIMPAEPDLSDDWSIHSIVKAHERDCWLEY